MTTDAAPTARYALDLLLDDAARLLMLKRSPQATLGPGLWGLPAGRIEPGETPQDAAWREMGEEIGPGHVVELRRHIGPFRDSFYGGQFEIHLFHFRWFDGEVVLNDEHTDYAWVSRESYLGYDVMDGIDEDIAMLDLWPRRFLDAARLPDHLKIP